MGARRQARELALQFLYQLEYNQEDLDGALNNFFAERKTPRKIRVFAEKLIRGVVRERQRIDQLLARCADNWDLRRMGTVERNVMRLALYEMLFCADIPPAVTINEAIEITKQYCDTESGHFVNGVLDRVRVEIGRNSHT